MRKYIVLFFLGLFFVSLQAQDSIAREKISKNYNKQGLKELNIKINKKYLEDSVRIKDYVKKNKIDSVKAKKIKRITPSGSPLIFKNNSLKQINSTNTNRVIDNNTSGLDLSGKGIIANVFDEGAALTTHQEFEGRVSNVTGNTDLIDHSTAVAGVMAAKGFDAEARGMANKLTIVSDSFHGNLNKKILNVAKNGSILSNHSYGLLTGWQNGGDGWEWWGEDNVSQVEDYKFGYYGEEDKAIDEIIFSAPNHTYVNAASNDNSYQTNGFGPSSGTSYISRSTNTNLNTSTKPRKKNCYTGFDCIPTLSLGKNIITVGSVEPLTVYSRPSDVVLASYSSVGPTDDGRIKPDLVAVGSDVYTTGINDNRDYFEINGTSFSSPSVAGIVALVQELFNKKRGFYMRSDLVKALLINTANETGNFSGPDYVYGWGLVDAYKAAQTILKDGTSTYLDKLLLPNGDSFSLELTTSIGSDVKVTMAWVDAPANPIPATSPNALNNRTKTLVNDLDIRIIDKDNPTNTFSPWILDVNNPGNAATKGDNNTDNVEQVQFTATSTKYLVSVTHKGSLTATTPFSLVANARLFIVADKLTVLFSSFDELNVYYPLANTSNKYDLYVYDYTGKIVSKTIQIGGKTSLKSLNLSSGLYIAVVKSGGQIANTKFIIK